MRRHFSRPHNLGVSLRPHATATARLLALFLALLPLTVLAPPVPPAWWAQRGATSASPPDDYAVANLGQLKHFAAKARDELDARLPGGAGPTLNALIASWHDAPPPGVTRDDFAAVNLGQLKYVASLFYDRLIETGYTTAYPWQSNTENTAMANLGQLKQVFSFDVALDSDNDTLPDIWEITQFGSLSQTGDDDADGDGLTNSQEQALGTNPTAQDSDGDGLNDADELRDGTSPTKKDSDGDGIDDNEDIVPLDPDLNQPHVSEPRYAVIDLTSLGFHNPAAINDALQIRDDPVDSGTELSRLWTAGEFVNIPNPNPGYPHVWAPGLSNLGKVVDYSSFRFQGDGGVIGIVSTWSQLQGLGELGFSHPGLPGYAVNDNNAQGRAMTALGIVVGVASGGLTSLAPGGSGHEGGYWYETGVIWNADTGDSQIIGDTIIFADSETNNGPGSGGRTSGLWFNSPVDVNENGLVIGTGDPSAQELSKALIYDYGTTERLPMFSTGGTPRSINNLEDPLIVGDAADGTALWVRRDGQWTIRRIRQYNPTTHDFFDIQGSAWKINDRCEILGNFSDAQYQSLGSLWQNGRVVNLDTRVSADYINVSPYALNNHGAMLAWATRVVDGTSVYVLLLPVEFVTKGTNDELKSIDGFYNGTPTPVVDANASNCAVSQEGIVTLTVSGTVADATSDLIDTPAKQLQSLTVKWPGGSAVSTLQNSAAPEPPWKPYKFRSNFSRAVSFAVSGPGAYPIDVQTTANAAGQGGATKQYVHVTEALTHIVLSGSLTQTTAEALRFYRGSTPLNDPSEVMEETGVATNTFQFEPTSDDFKIQILSGGALTAAVDSLSVRLSFKVAPNVYENQDLVFEETGPVTNDFVFRELMASCGKFPKTHPGTFLPVMVRFPVNSLLEAPDMRIKTMDREWKLKKKDFGDGEYLYIVDDQDKATGFNPSVNAQTHIQTKPVDESWAFNIMKGGNDLGVATLNRINGLLVAGSSVKDILRLRLKPETFEEVPMKLGSQTFYNYRPKRDANGNSISVEVTAPTATIQNSIEIATKQETLWKFVSLPDRIAFLPSRKALERDLTYRVNVVTNALAAKFAYIGDGLTQQKPKLNPQFWDPNQGHNITVAGIPTLCELRDPSVKASVAINDIFTNPRSVSDYATTLYAVACYPGAHIVAMRSISQTIGATAFDDKVGTAPWTGSGVEMVLEERPVTSAEADEIFWIPGDWGNFENLDWVSQGKLPGRQGENVIYLGGGYSKVRSGFENTAVFWGHGFGLGTMKYMLDQLHDWCGGTIKVNPMRRDFRQSE